VQERTKEIGLRKAVGAKNGDIVRQFLVETIAITFISGLIGIILGVIILASISLIVNGLGYSWRMIVSPMSILLGCVVSIGIGLIFGIAPARKASLLNPIEALRYE
jgi:ABC-type antimicrobial peptide transport system permease subunit